MIFLVKVEEVKNCRHGQAAVLSDADCTKIRKHLKNRQHRLIWDIARWTGERWGAVLQLQVEDVYHGRSPLDYITFRARTRKASPDGRRQTRQVPLHPSLREILEAYKPPDGGYLFPSPADAKKPLTLRAADLALRLAVSYAGLEAKGISTHSTRITFITSLHNRGISERTIQQLTGHKDLRVVSRYIVVTEDQAKLAIAQL